ncbi:MAG: amidohydrolase family protein [Dehalococcoidia bacterium]
MTIALVGGMLIDGTGGSIVPNATIVVEGDRITQVGPADQITVPAGARVIDLAGKTMMPGLIDTHVHICGETVPNPIAMLTDTVPFIAIRGTANARAILESGFTTCRSMGSPGYSDVAVKQAIEKGMVQGPRLVVSGEMVMTEGSGERGYMRPEVQIPESGTFVGLEGARRAVRTQVYHGADVIKLIASGRVGSNAYSMPWDTELTREEMAVVVDEAHRWGKKVAAHAYATTTVADCVMAGVDTIEHGVLIDEPTIALMAERGTALVPTMTAFHNYLLPGAEERFPAYRLERGRPMARVQLDSFPKYLEYGLKIATGSDGPRPGSLPGTSALELELLVEAGMSPMQAIEAATRVAAEILGLEDRLGTLESGRLADILVVDGDPISDIRVLQDQERIQMVVKGGEVVRSTL